MNLLVDRFSSGVRVLAAFERWSLLIYFLLLLALCTTEIALGAMPTRVYAHDYFVFLDGAWRMVNGQVPDRDFYSKYGVLVWNPLRWSLALYGYDINAIGLARAFFTAAIGIWFFLLNRLMPRARLSMIPGLFLLVFVAAARPLGEYPTWISHAMFYDRVAYALIMLIVFEQLHILRFESLPNAQPLNPANEFLRGASTGAALACAVLVRLSFAVPALLVLAAGLIIFGVRRRQLIGITAGVLAVFVFALLCLHFQPAYFLREVTLSGLQLEGITAEALRTLVNESGAFVFVLAAGFGVIAARGGSQQIAFRYLFATAVVAGCDLYCRATDSLNGNLPLATFWCLNCAVLLFFFPVPSAAGKLRRQRVMAMLVLCALGLTMFADDLASLVYAGVKTASLRRHAQTRIDAAPLHRWDPQQWLGKDPNFISRNGQQLVQATNDGLRLLKNASRPDETIFCIAYANPFPFALNRKPPLGGTLALDSVNLRHPLARQFVLGQPDLLMVERPNLVEQDALDTILAMYPGLLTTQFTEVAASQYWTLYRRRP